MQEKVFDIIFNGDEITWQSLIYELVKTEDMDPWDIDISHLTQRYIETLRKLQGLDVHISGKVVLAAALLLKIKSTKLVGEDIAALDSLFASLEASEESGFSDDADYGDTSGIGRPDTSGIHLIPRTPQPRKRKVSVYDLVEALQKALEVKQRRLNRWMPVEYGAMPTKKVDITQIIRQVYGRIQMHFMKNSGKATMTFTELLPSSSKEDKIYTFIPLLHLTNQRKIDIDQVENFGEIMIAMKKGSQETA